MINCSEGFHYFICICLSMLLFATPINNREVKHNRDNLAYVSINRAVGEYLFIIPSRQTGGRNRRPRAIETLAHSVLLWDHYVAGERKGARRDACTRAASNGRWCREPAHDAAAYVKGNGTGGRGEGRRGIARTSLPPPTGKPTGRGPPTFVLLFGADGNANLLVWLGPCQLGNYYSGRGKREIVKKPERAIDTATHTGERVSCYQRRCAARAPYIRLLRTTVKSSAHRARVNGCALSTRNELSSCTFTPPPLPLHPLFTTHVRPTRLDVVCKWEMRALSFSKLISIGSAV